MRCHGTRQVTAKTDLIAHGLRPTTETGQVHHVPVDGMDASYMRSCSHCDDAGIPHDTSSSRPLRYNDRRQVAVAMTRPMKSAACAA